MFGMGVKKHFKVVICAGTALFGLTAIAAHELEKQQSRSEWVSINAPDPPAPLPNPALTPASEPDTHLDLPDSR